MHQHTRRGDRIFSGQEFEIEMLYNRSKWGKGVPFYVWVSFTNKETSKWQEKRKENMGHSEQNVKVEFKPSYIYQILLPVPPLVSKNTGPPPMLPLTPSIRANLMSSDGFQCRFLWFMNQLLICFWSSPVTSDSFNFSSSCIIINPFQIRVQKWK